MNDPIITVENLSKRYLIGHQRIKREGLRHALESAMRSPLQLFKAKKKHRMEESEDFWALKDVSFEIKQGEVAGIIGRNGAGKSTLLKILSRITEPTSGRIRLKGRVASLLEVGTGFHAELTGRENIFLNGAILGMSKIEIRRKFDEIVAFSEVERFLDTPVKHYSSGMYVRLAFAVAAHLEPEILIVDEVLAVGDASFQKKCLGKMGDFAQSGRTVLFVSHNMDAVRNLCQRGIWMKDGRLHRDGDIDNIIEAYYSSVSSERSFSSTNPDYGLVIKKVLLKNDKGEESIQFCPGEDLVVEISYETQKPIEKPGIAIVVAGVNSTCFVANMLLDGRRPEVLDGAGKIACKFKSIPLLPHTYTVKMYIREKNGHDMILNYQDVAYFNVIGDLKEYGFKGEFLSRASNATHVIVPYEWQLPNGAKSSISLSRPLNIAS